MNCESLFYPFWYLAVCICVPIADNMDSESHGGVLALTSLRPSPGL